jgi:hypothetical protein
MIEDKELGLKVAEDPEEAMWHELKRKMEIETRQAKAAIELNEILLKHINKKLKSYSRAG